MKAAYFALPLFIFVAAGRSPVEARQTAPSILIEHGIKRSGPPGPGSSCSITCGAWHESKDCQVHRVCNCSCNDKGLPVCGECR